MEERNAYKELIMENIEYDLLCEKYGTTVVDEQVELILETVCTNKPVLKINGEEIPSQIVKQRFLKLGHQDIEYVFHSLSNTTTQVKNIRQYMLTVLYNSPTTRKQFYNAQVRHDMSV